MSKQLSELKSELRDVQNHLADIKADASQQKASATDLLRRLESMISGEKYARSEVKDLSAFPGIKQPKWYTVDIDFDYGDTESRRGEVVVSADGAFVCTQVQAYYLTTDTDPEHYATNPSGSETNTGKGRILPCSAYHAFACEGQYSSLLNVYAAFAKFDQGGTLFVGAGYKYPEFDFEIEVEGTGRYWASDLIPGLAFYGTHRPAYVAFEGVVENTDRLVVYAHPTATVGLKGKVRFVFHGYSISSKLNTRTFLKR